MSAVVGYIYKVFAASQTADVVQLGNTVFKSDSSHRNTVNIDGYISHSPGRNVDADSCIFTVNDVIDVDSHIEVIGRTDCEVDVSYITVKVSVTFIDHFDICIFMTEQVRNSQLSGTVYEFNHIFLSNHSAVNHRNIHSDFNVSCSVFIYGYVDYFILHEYYVSSVCGNCSIPLEYFKVS